jgi:hypothetical protein
VHASQTARPELGRHVDLVAELAGEAHAEEQHGHAATRPSATAMCGNVEPTVDARHERLEDFARARPLHGDDRPLLRDGSEPHLEVLPLGLAVVLHHREHARRAAGRRRHVEAVGREPRDDAVVIDEPVFAQQIP